MAWEYLAKEVSERFPGTWTDWKTDVSPGKFSFSGTFLRRNGSFSVKAVLKTVGGVSAVVLEVNSAGSGLRAKFAVHLANEGETEKKFLKAFDDGSSDYWIAVGSDLSEKKRFSSRWQPFREDAMPSWAKATLCNPARSFVEDVLFSDGVANVLSVGKDSPVSSRTA